MIILDLNTSYDDNEFLIQQSQVDGQACLGLSSIRITKDMAQALIGELTEFIEGKNAV